MRLRKREKEVLVKRGNIAITDISMQSSSHANGVSLRERPLISNHLLAWSNQSHCCSRCWHQSPARGWTRRSSSERVLGLNVPQTLYLRVNTQIYDLEFKRFKGANRARPVGKVETRQTAGSGVTISTDRL